VNALRISKLFKSASARAWKSWMVRLDSEKIDGNGKGAAEAERAS
jgi:hypothetical protein